MLFQGFFQEFFSGLTFKLSFFNNYNAHFNNITKFKTLHLDLLVPKSKLVYNIITNFNWILELKNFQADFLKYHIHIFLN